MVTNRSQISSGYDWNLNSDSGYCPNTDYRFTNNKKIDARTNFEGTIQIIDKLQPLLESGRSTGGSTRYLPIEEYGEDECTHSINSELIATLNDTVQSNSISFNYLCVSTKSWWTH